MVFFPIIHGSGSEIADTGSFSQVIALAHFVFDKEKELKETIIRIHELIHFMDENGNNMVIPMLKIETTNLKNKI